MINATFNIHRRPLYMIAIELVGLFEVRLNILWSQSGSNRRPPACKADALPAELWPHLYEYKMEV